MTSSEQKHRATYQGVNGSWRGVVKDAMGETVAVCRHIHWNRDTSSQSRGPSARSCASQLLQQVDPEAFEAGLPSWMRQAR